LCASGDAFGLQQPNLRLVLSLNPGFSGLLGSHAEVSVGSNKTIERLTSAPIDGLFGLDGSKTRFRPCVDSRQPLLKGPFIVANHAGLLESLPNSRNLGIRPLKEP
jgi:hypothetical protein